jgi:hypothetical protein
MPLPSGQFRALASPAAFILDFNLPPITALPNFTLDASSSVIYNLYDSYHIWAKNGSNFRTQYKSIQNLQTLQGYIFRISQPNFAILLILVCSFYLLA